MYIDDSSSSSTSKLKATRTSKKNKSWFLFPYFHQKISTKKVVPKKGAPKQEVPKKRK